MVCGAKYWWIEWQGIGYVGHNASLSFMVIGSLGHFVNGTENNLDQEQRGVLR